MVTVAVPVPLHRVFDYLVPDARAVPVGCRVRVPFGRGHRIGFVVPRAAANVDGRELKRITEVIDSEPLFDDALFDLLCWASDYYQHPLGEVLQAAVPARIRRGKAPPPGERRYRLAAPIESVLESLPARAVRQRELARHLAGLGEPGADRGALKAAGVDTGDVLRRLEARGLVECSRPIDGVAPRPGPRLNARQREAVDAVNAAGGNFACFLLMGVTGSGKTEVYLQCARHVIEFGRQVLVLVPEIALTPQLIERFRARLGRAVAVMHSGLGDGERQRARLQAASGEADVVLGTRLAVFSRLAKPGLVIVDEEHDTSFKQQEGFRYHARDVAIKRAAVDGVPVVLGSATPSLESYQNAASGRYRLLALPERAGAASLPDIRLVDATRWPLTDGLSQPLVKAIDERLARGEQSLVFINRRGFAPVVICGGCGWQARCTRCDSFLTLHRRENLLRCHHCGQSRQAPAACPACAGGDIYFAGAGTQRIEQALAARFPAARITRIDRDTSTARGSLEAHLERVRRREVDILVGTQLLSKGHDFPASRWSASSMATGACTASTFAPPSGCSRL
ncbi:MAG: primosomal protein N' [Gammaproteobacteria bacterium]|nr:primosomal protein N' [Gammaproteobacteria bacterium]